MKPVRIDAEYPNGTVCTTQAPDMATARRRAMIYRGVNVTLTPADYSIKQERYPVTNKLNIDDLPPVMPILQVAELPAEVSPTLGNALHRIEGMEDIHGYTHRKPEAFITVELKADCSPMLESIRKAREEVRKANEDMEAMDKRAAEHYEMFKAWGMWIVISGLCLLAAGIAFSHYAWIK